ncbi:hypothetical protein NL676_003382 [Syzygium grande]|nr:hypothetical protein NL676_003382 [Syzygium grande]
MRRKEAAFPSGKTEDGRGGGGTVAVSGGWVLRGFASVLGGARVWFLWAAFVVCFPSLSETDFPSAELPIRRVATSGARALESLGFFL